MDRRDALVLLGVCAVAVFLAGLELMVTAVALPAIITDLADWGELRRASWIVNGYLLVSIVTMPIAGRLADGWGARPLLYGGLIAFVAGSALSGAAQSLDTLIAARLVQAVGAGTLIPVATAAASHLFSGHERPRALGVVGAATFLGMAAGPFVGAAVLRSVHPEGVLAGAELMGGGASDLLAPAWRWVFYLNVPIGLGTRSPAASAGWETPRTDAHLDPPGTIVFTVGLAGLLLGITLLGEGEVLAAGALSPSACGLAAAIAIICGAPTRPSTSARSVTRYAGATLVSLLTGYGFATAIIGAAVVDRALYGGPADQQVASARSPATAVGALASGWLVRRLLGQVTSAGSWRAAALPMARWDPATTLAAMADVLALFGLGFGATVTPRSTAAVEALGPAAFGVAAATVTVARMIGMAVGLAVLTAYGSTTIDRVTDQVFSSPAAYLDLLPPELAGRPLNDGLVVAALEAWAAGEAARVLGGVVLVAAAVTVAARRRRWRWVAGRVCSPASPAPTGRRDSPMEETEGDDDRTGRHSPLSRSFERRTPATDDPPRDAILRIVIWTPGGTRESTDPADLGPALSDPMARVWIDVTDPSTELIEAIGSLLGLHPLVAEDIVERNQRAKIEFTDPTLHLVLFALRYDGGPELSEIDLGLGALPAQRARACLAARGGARAAARRRAGARPGRRLPALVLADAIVDEYFPVLDRLGEEMDLLQDDVVEKADRWTLERLFILKRELIELRRALAPTRETVGQLTNRQIELIAPEHVIYFRDVYDHLIRSTEELDTLRDLSSGTLEVYLSQVNNTLSLIMKRLTGVTVLLAGIGAIAGIFGMSEAGAVFRGGEATGFWLVAIGSVVAGPRRRSSSTASTGSSRRQPACRGGPPPGRPGRSRAAGR
jgi:magnesium transporter